MRACELSELDPVHRTVNGSTITVATLDGYQAYGPSRYMNYGNGLWRSRNFDATAGDAAAREDGERGLLPTDLLPWLRRLANPVRR